MKHSQKVIVEVIKTNKLITPNANDSFEIIDTFNRLDRSNNYSFQFKKTQEFWSDSNWKTVARDIKEQL